MRIVFILLSLVMTIATLSYGQTAYVPPKVSKKLHQQLHDAVLTSKAGHTAQAIASIQSIIDKYPTWTEPRQELSRILFLAGKKQEAIQVLESALAIDTLSQIEQLYTLGRLYEQTNQPQKAIACYQAVILKCGAQESLKQKAIAGIRDLEAKNSLWKIKYPIEFTAFPADINTPEHESLGRWTLDGEKFIFTRLTDGQEDIFIVGIDSLDDSRQIESFPFNTSQNEGAHAISPNGKYLVFTSCNRNDGMGSCDLYLSSKKIVDWTLSVNMGPAFNSAAWDGQPCFGLDGLSLFFSSNREGGYGGRDIWYVYQISAGNWSKPINAGPMINTPDNEGSPFVHFDGRTLYFMRDGKKGLGGYDLYIARKALDGQWQEPQNLGAPINSGEDEGALSIHPNGSTAVITRYTAEGKNDLFEFELPEPYQAAPLQALHVTIRDQETRLPVRARLEIFETNLLDTVRLSQWADEEGKISVTLERNKRYGLIAIADQYLMYSSGIEASRVGSRSLEIMMTAIKSAAESITVLRNVFFETGSADLLKVSETELNKLMWTMTKNETMKIEIRGHTDHVGDDQTNQVLSEARAKSVYQYLISRGIDASRMSYMGYGESQPIADNETEDGRRLNRRTEFKIIQN